MIYKSFKRGFSLVEVLWGVFLLATAIVVIAGVIISALQAIKKSDAVLDATNILIQEKAKIKDKDYTGILTGDSYTIDDYYVIYSVDQHDFTNVTDSITEAELKIVTLGVYNVSPTYIDSTPPDKLVRVITTTVLFYNPPSL